MVPLKDVDCEYVFCNDYIILFLSLFFPQIRHQPSVAFCTCYIHWSSQAGCTFKTSDLLNLSFLNHDTNNIFHCTFLWCPSLGSALILSNTLIRPLQKSELHKDIYNVTLKQCCPLPCDNTLNHCSRISYDRLSEPQHALKTIWTHISSCESFILFSYLLNALEVNRAWFVLLFCIRKLKSCNLP